MPDGRVVASIVEVGREAWDALFPGELETYDYLLAVEQSGIEGFRWRYALAEERGRLVAAAPAFLTDYSLETTLVGPARRLVGNLRKVFPNALTLRLACIGSPVTETSNLGLAPDLDPAQSVAAVRAMMGAFEREARAERCGLFAVKDVPAPQKDLWDQAIGPGGYKPIAGLPVAYIDIDFPDLDAYLGRLSYTARKDMRRKLRALDQVRIEVRGDLGDEADRVLALYQATRARAEMTFEDLPRAYFTGVAEHMPGRCVYVLYYSGEDLIAANLLLQGETTLLDKFFVMELERGRPLNLYFLSWFTNLRLCLERGLTRYVSGQAAYENKLRLGSALTRTSMYFRHRNAIVNGAMQLVAPLFAADPTLKTAA
jgi:predicted N-acyltransferase